MSVDYSSGTVSVVRKNGTIEVGQGLATQSAGLVTRATFIPDRSRLEIMAAGRSFTMSIGTIREPPSRPTIYLDQNHWIDFARWHTKGNLDEDKKPFFDLLAQAARDELVIIPLSAAHLAETAKREGQTRIDVASTMLTYSAGWQLRDVLALRRAELRALFGRGNLPTAKDAVTLEPDAVLSTRTAPPINDDLDPEISGLLRRVLWGVVLASLLIDDERDTDPARRTLENWANSFQELAVSMRGNPHAKPRIRDLTRTRFLTDLGADLANPAQEAGLSPDEFAEWFRNDAERELASIPGLARLREVLHLRLANADDKWEGNDLNDWLHLSYAGAYCDLVLGEKKTINYLRRADGDVPPGALLHRRSTEALPDLRSLL